MTKWCNGCSKELPIDSFAKKNNTVQSRCRKCHSEYTRKHYSENTAYYISKARKNSNIQRDRVRDLMLERFKNGCVDCGNDDVRVLQFDHLKDKKIAVSELLKLGASSKKVVEELDKCDVVCANCHSIRTSSRAYDWRSKIHTSVYPLATNESEG